MIEADGKWPEDLTRTRAAFLAREDEEALEPLGFRCLLMLASLYRLWATTRLNHLEPWVEQWSMEEILAGVAG